MPQERIIVVDFGGQYANLIARRIRDLGVYSEIKLPESPVNEYKGAKGIILSGGPNSVYEGNAPKIEKKLLELGIPVLGICYGHQLLAYSLKGNVERGEKKEYGIAELDIVRENELFKGLDKRQIVWMSHGDTVSKLPEGFEIIGSTKNCKISAMGNSEKKIYGVQFHPEVVHTKKGMKILENFIKISQCKRTWSMDNFLEGKIEEIKKQVGVKKVLVLASGGVDSTVCLAILSKALGPDKILAFHVDHGFMRKNEAKEVRKALDKLGYCKLQIIDAKKEFMEALCGIINPEDKRIMIGELFLIVKDKKLKMLNMNPEEWVLCQGTIYPDTIESARTKHADKIKTHHNRVEQIIELIEKGHLIEPLEMLYKDEVRKLGKKLGLPEKILWKHPFPGPGLAIRVLCSNGELEEAILKTEKLAEKKLKGTGYKGKILPLKSVGVQGDSRTYRHAVLLSGKLDWEKLGQISTKLTNEIFNINRAVYSVEPQKVDSIELIEGKLTEERVSLLRNADAIVREELEKNKIYYEIWQCPVVLLPVKVNGKKEAVVIRAIESTEAMTANFYRMNPKILDKIANRLMKLKGISAVFYDVTNKPPATIEWE
ncbi:MAG: glutamine-hydrolyzing GMP synthase [Candidatus Diapherotrites archaeon CG08_land_8_20_14_0_20_34_12]|nr:MAG: glutamine-hydrolyzing GMP synthase [Candidatus Diapherotrites archaeon CG08_land_8_20_14_0_20_34_12]